MRTTFPIAVLAAFAASLAPAAPVPKEAREAPYFPTKVGTKLVYQDENGKNERVHEVKAAANTKDGLLVEMEYREAERSDAPSGSSTKVLVSAAGITYTELGGEKYDPPVRMLKLPHAAGAGWDTSYALRTMRTKGTAKAGKAEQVTVPAGTFTALPVAVEYAIELPPNALYTRTATLWYAPGVGLVKSVSKDGDQETVRVLVSVSVPKD